MRAYVITTGATFALLTLVHVWLVIVEPHHATDPWYILATLIAAGLGVWAWRLLRGRKP